MWEFINYCVFLKECLIIMKYINITQRLFVLNDIYISDKSCNRIHHIFGAGLSRNRESTRNKINRDIPQSFVWCSI